MKSLSEQVILVTGSTDGLGKTIATRLAEQGATVLLHGRSPEKGELVKNEIISFTGNKKIKYFNSDFSSLQSVRDLGANIQEEYQNLDILINNAGIGGNDVKSFSAEGYELCFTVNYLAPFLLTHLLLPLLHQSYLTKIINIASLAQRELDFNDLMLNNKYSGKRAYAQSKLALILFTFTLAGQFKDSKLRINAIHPETLMNTKMVLNRYGSAETSVTDGANNVLHLALSTGTENITGAFFNRREMEKANEQAYDIIARDKLYRLSKELARI